MAERSWKEQIAGLSESFQMLVNETLQRPAAHGGAFTRHASAVRAQTPSCLGPAPKSAPIGPATTRRGQWFAGLPDAHPSAPPPTRITANDNRSPTRGGQLPAPLALLCRRGRHRCRRPLGLVRSRSSAAAPERRGEEAPGAGTAEGSASPVAEGAPPPPLGRLRHRRNRQEPRRHRRHGATPPPPPKRRPRPLPRRSLRRHRHRRPGQPPVFKQTTPPALKPSLPKEGARTPDGPKPPPKGLRPAKPRRRRPTRSLRRRQARRRQARAGHGPATAGARRRRCAARRARGAAGTRPAALRRGAEGPPGARRGRRPAT